MDIEDNNKFEKNLFKDPKWHDRKKSLKQSRNQRLNKNLKQICNNEILSKNKYNCIINNFLKLFHYIFAPSIDMSIDGPPPLKPPKSYCDITGYEVFL